MLSEDDFKLLRDIYDGPSTRNHNTTYSVKNVRMVILDKSLLVEFVQYGLRITFMNQSGEYSNGKES